MNPLQRFTRNAGSHLLEKEKAVQSVMRTISSMQNPFTADENGVMYNISSGRIAPDSVSNDLTACTTGEQRLKEFVEARLVSDKVGFLQALPKLNLKTFSTLAKKKKQLK